jgi:hypothetical protein
MKTSKRPELVPASLVRLRCFINRRGMKVKPWLGPGPVLAAFHTVLMDRQHDDSFWTELGGLLRDLSHDLGRRTHGAVSNELLDAGRHAALLEEIRAALGGRPGGLRQLTAALSAPAAALVLMLGAAVAVGCGGDTDSNENPAATGGTSAGGAATGGAATGGQILVPTGGSGNLDAGVFDSGWDGDVPTGCNPALVTELASCAATAALADQVVACACSLEAAWQGGLADLFADKSCTEILDYLGCCGLDSLCNLASSSSRPASFDATLLADNSCCLVYMGVRCD